MVGMWPGSNHTLDYGHGRFTFSPTGLNNHRHARTIHAAHHHGRNKHSEHDDIPFIADIDVEWLDT